MATRIDDPKAAKAMALLKRLREQKGLSIRTAAQRCGKSAILISHIENGWHPLREHHLAWLLPMYEVPRRQFDLMLRGDEVTPTALRSLIQKKAQELSDGHLELVHGLIVALTTNSEPEVMQ